MHVYTRVQVHLPMHVGVGQRLCQDIFLNLFLTFIYFHLIILRNCVSLNLALATAARLTSPQPPPSRAGLQTHISTPVFVLFVLLFIQDRALLYSPGWTGTHYIVHAVLQLGAILLSAGIRDMYRFTTHGPRCSILGRVKYEVREEQTAVSPRCHLGPWRIQGDQAGIKCALVCPLLVSLTHVLRGDGFHSTVFLFNHGSPAVGVPYYNMPLLSHFSKANCEGNHHYVKGYKGQK